jgi:hypothetical protein
MKHQFPETVVLLDLDNPIIITRLITRLKLLNSIFDCGANTENWRVRFKKHKYTFVIQP